MKVECINNTDPQTGKEKDDYWISIGKVYLVLSLWVNPKGEIYFTMLTNNSPTPISYDASLFKTVCNKIPSNWRCEYSDGYLTMGPEKWINDSLWEYSFWEDLYSHTSPEAWRVFQEELDKMIAEVG